MPALQLLLTINPLMHRPGLLGVERRREWGWVAAGTMPASFPAATPATFLSTLELWLSPTSWTSDKFWVGCSDISREIFRVGCLLGHSQ